MTTPSRPNVIVHHEPVTETWTLTLADPGPAGAHTLRLPDGVDIGTDRLMDGLPLRLRFSCDTHGRWPEGIVELAALLFGRTAADALDRQQLGPVPYDPPVDPGRDALLRLARADTWTGTAGRAMDEAMNAAIAAGAAVPARAEIPLLQRAAARYAAAVAHVLRLLPADLTAARPEAGMHLAAVTQCARDLLGEDLRLAAAPPAAPEPEPAVEARASRRILIGDHGGSADLKVILLPVHGMRLSPGVACGERPEVLLTQETKSRTVRWRLSAPLLSKGLPLPWVRVVDENGTPLLHIHTRITDERIEAPLPDLSILGADTLHLELLTDPGTEALSPAASRRLAAIRQAQRAMRTEPELPTSARRAQHWEDSARSWREIGEHPKAMIAYDLAAAADPDPRHRRRYNAAAATLRARACRADLTTYDLHRAHLNTPAPLDRRSTNAGRAALGAVLDEWVCTELARLPREGRGSDLAGRIGYWRTLATIGSPTDPVVREQRRRAGLMLAVEALRSGLRSLARRTYVQLVADDADTLADPFIDPTATRLLDELADALHRDQLDDNIE